MDRRTRISLGSALCLAIAASAACGKKGDAPNDTTRVSTGTVDAGSSLRVSDVTLGKSIGADKKVQNETDDFGTRDTVFASVTTNGTASNATLVARWMFEDGQTVEEQQQTVSGTGGDAVTEFHIAKPSGWPKGKYMLHVLLNGNQVETEEFEVK